MNLSDEEESSNSANKISVNRFKLYIDISGKRRVLYTSGPKGKQIRAQDPLE